MITINKHNAEMQWTVPGTKDNGVFGTRGRIFCNV